MLKNIKKIVSWTLGIPAALIVCSEAQSNEGIALQFIALGVLGVILFANGLFKREEVYGRQ